MLNTKNLDRTSLDSLSSAYLSDQSPDDLSLLHRLNTLLSSNNLPRLTNILDVTPSLLIALYESLPPFQRVPFVDSTAPDFATKLRNMKLLAGSIASGQNGLLTENMRQQLEELDLRKFCEKDADTVRNVIEVIVDVGERGIQARVSVAVPKTPRNRKLGPKGTPKTIHIMERCTGNNVEGSPTPWKKRPVLVLPVTSKTEDSEVSTDKDSGWDGSILEAMSQTTKADPPKIGFTNAGYLARTIVPDLPKPRKTALAGRSSSAAPSPSSCSEVPPGFIEHLSARVNAIVARSPAPSPHSKDLQGRNNVECVSDTSRGRLLVHGGYPITKGMPGRALVMDRVQRHNARSEKFGGELRAPSPAGGLSSTEKGGKKPSGDIVLKDQKGNIRITKGKGLGLAGENSVNKGGDKNQWVTEDESGNETPLSFSSLAKKEILDFARRTSTPIKASGLNAEVAAHIPLPTSRSASTTSRNSKQGNDPTSKSPLPFPPSLLRTMHWATSLPTPPLSPNTQKMGTRLATPTSHSEPKTHLPMLRRAASASPLPLATQKKRIPVKRYGSAGLMNSPGGVASVGSQGDSDEWVSTSSRGRPSTKNPKQGTRLRPSQDGKKRTPLSFATSSLAPSRKVAITTTTDSKDIYGHGYSDNDEHDDDDYDYDDDKTSLYSASTVSWGEDDPFTAALRQKRHIALEKLQEMERSFNEEIETKKRTRVESRERSVNDKPRWRAFPDNEDDETRDTEIEEHPTDSEGGVTDVEEELRLLEEIGRRESVRQQLLLKRLMARGT